LWISGTKEKNGAEVETMLYLCWWSNSQREEEFNGRLVMPEPKKSRLEDFKIKAKNGGVFDITEEHCIFAKVKVPDCES
jgi:hypothetical protein